MDGYVGRQEDRRWVCYTYVEEYVEVQLVYERLFVLALFGVVSTLETLLNITAYSVFQQVNLSSPFEAVCNPLISNQGRLFTRHLMDAD
jgi:hypothetical protein